MDHPLVVTLSPGESYSETYRYASAYNPATNADSSIGVSIKITSDRRLSQATTESERIAAFQSSPITQLEYTYDPTLYPAPDLYYDVSDIDDTSPRQFCQYGITLQPESAECQPVTCLPDCHRNCSAVYNYADDDFATYGCHSDSALTMLLCSNG